MACNCVKVRRKKNNEVTNKVRFSEKKNIQFCLFLSIYNIKQLQIIIITVLYIIFLSNMM